MAFALVSFSYYLSSLTGYFQVDSISGLLFKYSFSDLAYFSLSSSSKN